MEGLSLGPSGEDITWPDQVAPRGRKASSTRKIKPQTSNLIAVSVVVFAGHVVGNGQWKPIPGKVATIEHWEKPKTVSELRAYLGFCNYYSGYIKMYAEYAAPMTAMLKGNSRGDQKGVQEGCSLE